MDDRTTITLTDELTMTDNRNVLIEDEIIKLGRIVRWEWGFIETEIERTWKERLFSLPWRPWVRWKWEKKWNRCPVYEATRGREF